MPETWWRNLTALYVVLIRMDEQKQFVKVNLVNSQYQKPYPSEYSNVVVIIFAICNKLLNFCRNFSHSVPDYSFDCGFIRYINKLPLYVTTCWKQQSTGINQYIRSPWHTRYQVQYMTAWYTNKSNIILYLNSVLLDVYSVHKYILWLKAQDMSLLIQIWYTSAVDRGRDVIHILLVSVIYHCVK